MNIDRAIQISDYDCLERRDELNWLAEQASQRRLIVDVGSWKGATARAMADNTTGTVYAVDSFMGSYNEKQMWETLKAHDIGWLEETCCNNLNDLVNVHVYKSWSYQAARWFAERGAYPDMIFLDASHDFESVCEDIQTWMKVLAPGGLLCGHDRQMDGVEQALKELIPNYQHAVGAIWRKP